MFKELSHGRSTNPRRVRQSYSCHKDKNARSGHALNPGQVNLQFINNGGTAAEYQAGGQYALDQGWIELSSTSMRLTDKGFAEM
jgi:acyl CoA:acetate/3-ketoacid CoA transferase alpha subunit